MQSFPLPKSRVKDVMVSNLQASVRKRLFFGAQSFQQKKPTDSKYQHDSDMPCRRHSWSQMDFDGMYDVHVWISDPSIPPGYQTATWQGSCQAGVPAVWDLAWLATLPGGYMAQNGGISKWHLFATCFLLTCCSQSLAAEAWNIYTTGPETRLAETQKNVRMQTIHLWQDECNFIGRWTRRMFGFPAMFGGLTNNV